MGHAFRKGCQTDYVKKKVERFKLGLAIECKRHGEHSKWRLHTDNNVQCLHCAAKWQMDQRRRHPLRFILKDARVHARRKERLFDITLNDLESCLTKQNNLSALTGMKFDEINIMSLDRIDSEKGYTIDNIQLIDARINVMKSNFKQNEFIDLCSKIIAYAEARRGKTRKKK